MVIVGRNEAKNMLFCAKCKKNTPKTIVYSKIIYTFALAKQKWEVLYGQLLVNPPGLDRSKGSRS